MKNATLAASLLTAIAIVPFQTAYAEEDGKFTLETGMDRNTGKYGGSQSTDILYVPFTGKYQGGSWTLKMTVPYLQITGPGNVINVINGIATTGAASTPITRSGLGDVVVAATRNAYNGGSSGFMVNLTGKVKLGTADSAKGLGTGKNDYAFQSELFQVTKSITTFGTLGYRFYGSPVGYTLNNIFYGSLGASYKYDQETNAGIMFTLSQKTTAKGSTHVETILFASHKLDKNWKTQGYVLKGFTNSVPSWGIGATISYRL